MNLDFPVILGAALIPLLIGFIWYHPKLFGNAWMRSAGVSQEKMQNSNMALIFILTYIFCVLIGMTLNFVTIHQWALMSLISQTGNNDVNTPGTELHNELLRLLDIYGNRYRTFGHGAVHGGIAGVFLAFPLVAVNSFFERRGWKYIFINSGFWLVCFILMGGIICAYSKNY